MAFMGLLLLTACNGGKDSNRGGSNLPHKPTENTPDTLVAPIIPDDEPEIKTYSIEDAVQCLKQTNLEVITYQDMMKLCQSIHPEIADFAESNGIINELALKYFQLLKPKPESFATFKNILKSMVLENSQILEVEGKSSLIQQIAQNQFLVNQALEANPLLLPFEEGFRNISFEWSFFTLGEIGADSAMLMNVALEMNDPFNKSFNAIVNKLVQNPTHYQAIRALNFAHAIVDKAEYKATALKALEMANAKNDPSVEKKLDQAFQKEVTIEQMKNWIKLLER